MKRVERERTTTTKYEVFVAMDGREFVDQEQCKKWESNLECTIEAGWNKIPKTEIGYDELFWSGCEDDYLIIIKPRNMEDISIINMKCHLSKNDLLTQDDIGKEISFTECCGDWWKISCKKPFKDIIADIKKQEERAKSDLDNYGFYEVRFSCGTCSDSVKAYSLYECMNTVQRKIQNHLWKFEGFQKAEVNIDIIKDDEDYKQEVYSVEYDKAIGWKSFKFELKGE